jgi:hypothetical protein
LGIYRAVAVGANGISIRDGIGVRVASCIRFTGAALLRPTGSDTEAKRSAFEGETGDARIIADFVQAIRKHFSFLEKKQKIDKLEREAPRKWK